MWNWLMTLLGFRKPAPAKMQPALEPDHPWPLVQPGSGGAGSGMVELHGACTGRMVIPEQPTMLSGYRQKESRVHRQGEKIAVVHHELPLAQVERTRSEEPSDGSAGLLAAVGLEIGRAHV